MAVFSATDYKISINGTNFSSSLTQAELDLASESLETTAFGDGFRKRGAKGLSDASLTLSFNQDFGSSSVHQTLYTLWASSSPYATVIITPTSSSISATNPGGSGVFFVEQYKPFASNVGDLATFDVTWPSHGTVAFATA